jgi:hypothetical protein
MGVDQEIIFALQRTKMGWRIADIQYKDGRSLWKILKGIGLVPSNALQATPPRRCVRPGPMDGHGINGAR